MKSDYHRGTILLTNGIHNNIQLQDKSRHHHISVSVIESTKSIPSSSSSGSSGRIVGYINGSQVKGSGNMSVHDDPRIAHKVNLAAAFHDHISCTKLPSQMSKNGGDINSLIGASLSNGSCIDTNNSLFGAAVGSSNEDKIQIKKLKEMILMQLDLIQHQQEQLLKKERQLQGLKHDRESLCLKIDKMENRITLLTRKLMEANSTETPSSGINDNTHPESINELNAQSSDSEVMISCMSDTNDVSNMFTVYSTPSPPSTSTSNPAIVSPRTNSNQLIASSNQSSQTSSCGTQTISSGDIGEINEKNKSKSNSGDKKVKVNVLKPEIKKDDGSTIPEKKNNAKESKKSATKRKRPSTSLSNTTSTSLATTTTVTTTSSSLTPSTTTTSTKSASQVFKDELPVSNDKPPNSESNIEEVSSSQTCSVSKKRRRTVSKSGSSTPSDQPVNNNVNCKPNSTNVNVLETDEPYDLYNCRQEKSIIQRMESSSRDTLIKINQIEVPSWRLITVPDSSSTEGIENLDDDTYLKRHQKLENDERRRKRWDIQRLREQKLNEKLRSGRYYYSAVNFDKPPCTTGQNKQIALDLISFFPDPKGVQFIEVSDKIPVMAFGLPIPKLPPKHFTLPWLKSSLQP